MLGKLSELQNLDLLAGCFYEQRAWSYVSVPHKLYMLQVRVYRRSDPDGQPLQQLETASLTLPEPTCPESSTSPLLLLWASLAACACYETGSVACIIATFPRAIQVRVSLPKTHNTQAGPAQDLSKFRSARPSQTRSAVHQVANLSSPTGSEPSGCSPSHASICRHQRGLRRSMQFANQFAMMVGPLRGESATALCVAAAPLNYSLCR